MSNYLEEEILSAIVSGGTYTGGDVWIALYTTAPTDEDLGLEVAGGNYARQQATFTTPIQTDGKATVENVDDITFPVATADWGTITHVGLRDAETGGNLLFHKSVNNPRTILTSDRVRFLEGELKVDMS